MIKLHENAPRLIPILIQQVPGTDWFKSGIERDSEGKQILPTYRQPDGPIGQLPIHEDGPIEWRVAFILGEIHLRDIHGWTPHMRKYAEDEHARILPKTRSSNIKEAAAAWGQMKQLAQRAANDAELFLVTQEKYTTVSTNNRVFTQPKRLILVTDDQDTIDKYEEENQKKYFEQLEAQSGAAFVDADF